MSLHSKAYSQRRINSLRIRALQRKIDELKLELTMRLKAEQAKTIAEFEKLTKDIKQVKLNIGHTRVPKRYIRPEPITPRAWFKDYEVRATNTIKEIHQQELAMRQELLAQAKSVELHFMKGISENTRDKIRTHTYLTHAELQNDNDYRKREVARKKALYLRHSRLYQGYLHKTEDYLEKKNAWKGYEDLFEKVDRGEIHLGTEEFERYLLDHYDEMPDEHPASPNIEDFTEYYLGRDEYTDLENQIFQMEEKIQELKEQAEKEPDKKEEIKKKISKLNKQIKLRRGRIKDIKQTYREEKKYRKGTFDFSKDWELL